MLPEYEAQPVTVLWYHVCPFLLGCCFMCPVQVGSPQPPDEPPEDLAVLHGWPRQGLMWQAADWLLLLEGHGAEAMDSTSIPPRWLQHHLPLLSIFLPPGSALTGPRGKMLEQTERA